jgi:hypothetical protein
MYLSRKYTEKYAISVECTNAENCTEVEYVNEWSVSGTLLGICILVIFLTAEIYGIYVLATVIPTFEDNLASVIILTFQVCVMMVIPVVAFGAYYFSDDSSVYNLWCVRIIVAISWSLFLANVLMFLIQSYDIYNVKTEASLILFTVIDFLVGVWSTVGWLDGDF